MTERQRGFLASVGVNSGTMRENEVDQWFANYFVVQVLHGLKVRRVDGSKLPHWEKRLLGRMDHRIARHR
jgi:hypothetical protein